MITKNYLTWLFIKLLISFSAQAFDQEELNTTEVSRVDSESLTAHPVLFISKDDDFFLFVPAERMASLIKLFSESDVFAFRQTSKRNLALCNAYAKWVFSDWPTLYHELHISAGNVEPKGGFWRLWRLPSRCFDESIQGRKLTESTPWRLKFITANENFVRQNHRTNPKKYGNYLQGSSFRGENLTRYNFDNANLRFANLSRSVFFQVLDLTRGGRVSRARFEQSGAKASKTNVVSLKNADLTGACLVDAYGSFLYGHIFFITRDWLTEHGATWDKDNPPIVTL